MDTKFTPGPWKLATPGIGIGIQSADGKWVVTSVNGTGGYALNADGKHDEAPEANANLIAAAPELAAVAEAVLMFHSGSQWTQEKADRWHDLLDSILGRESEATTKCLCDAVRAALAKAEGRHV